MSAPKTRLVVPSIPFSLAARPLCPQIPLPHHQWTHKVAGKAIEEQTLPFYHQKHYYPIKIGQILNDRYRVIAKPGYGAYSTVWLARDERTKEFTSLKVSVQTNDTEASHVLNEINMLRRLKKLSHKDHPGLDFIRLAQDIFEIDNRHYCIVSKPQGNSVRALQEVFPNAIIPKLLVKSLLHRLFFVVNWLHSTCGVAHTDISPQNILMEIEDDSSLQDVENQEAMSPSISIITGDGEDSTIVYQSRPTMLELSGHPVLTDFGQMRLVKDRVNQDWWMPDIYRAPEVLLKLPWGTRLIYGQLTLELLEGKNLFKPVVDDQYILPLALAQYIGYLGPPPPEIVQQSPIFSAYFDSKGNWKHELPIPETSLEEFVTTIPPGEEKDQFLRFIRRLLTWEQDKRATTNEIIPDEWLMRPIDLS